MVLGVGLMSGTSCDGIDAALVDISGSGSSTNIVLLRYVETKMPSTVREKILHISSGGATTAGEVALLSKNIAELFAKAAKTVIEEHGLNPCNVSFIGTHGQTIYHNPNEAMTLQIGTPSIIAQRTGCTTVADFRAADMALGGQGAPLIPYVDFLLHKSHHEARILVNVGGIANVTILPANARLDQVCAFDTGPGNMLMDQASAYYSDDNFSYDENGTLAKGGNLNENVLNWLLQHPFLKKPPPKSTGRDEFGIEFFHQLVQRFPDVNSKDMLATLNWFTAQTIWDAIAPFASRTGASSVWASGGGARNFTLMCNLQKICGHSCQVMGFDDVAFNSDAREAVAFAVLANETLHGITNNVPSVTGAEKSVVLGGIYPGRPGLNIFGN